MLKYSTDSTNFLDTEKKTPSLVKNRYLPFTQFKIHIPWEQFIKGGILICFFQISKNNQVELLYENSNFTAISRKPWF